MTPTINQARPPNKKNAGRFGSHSRWRDITAARNFDRRPKRSKPISDIVEAVRAVSEGKQATEPLSFIWGVHEGSRGATWIIVQGEGKVLERRYVPSAKREGGLPTKELGTVPASAVQSLAGTLLSQNFDQIQSPPLTKPAAPTATAVELTIAVGEERFARRVYSQLLDQTPAMRVIATAFAQLRAQLKP